MKKTSKTIIPLTPVQIQNISENWTRKMLNVTTGIKGHQLRFIPNFETKQWELNLNGVTLTESQKKIVESLQVAHNTIISSF